ncbi:MAG: hypothetical protein CBB68_06035 [Rhodospirillaceae bacterium TMED8]|nr:hypothetical protein [Magnetovibrio sp.]OUT51184.1 MAG: hypothetical protein CBB68_06035 [Rhodospirillaceae bacterium TMED8]
MKYQIKRVMAVGAALMISACSFYEDSLWPSLTGDDPTGNENEQKEQAVSPSTETQKAQSPRNASAQPERSIIEVGQPALGTGNFVPTGVTPGQSTGTFVGAKVKELRSELQRLQGNISQQNGELQKLRSQLVSNSRRYHGTIAAVNARLQVGTTPGNPILIQQFKSAQTDLNRLAQDVATMNTLANAIGSSSTMSAFLSESAKSALTISGAVDEDHQQLAILEDEVNRTDVLIDRLSKEVAGDVRRQTNYVTTEQANLNLTSAGIKSGEIYGGSLLNVAMASASGGLQVSAGPPRTTKNRRPLVVIRFDRNDVKYQRVLYNAVSRVLEKRADAVFDLVAVAPDSGGKARVALNSNKARRQAEGVLRSLIEMGLPPARVAIAAKTSSGTRINEVHLYIR